MAGQPACPRFAWLDLISLATHDTFHKPVKLDVIKLERGEFLASLRYLAQRWMWSKNRVARFLSELVDRNQIVENFGTAHGTVYRIVNYDTYQVPWDRDRDTEGTAKGQQRDKDNTQYTPKAQKAPKKTDGQNNGEMTAQELVGFWIDQRKDRPPSGIIAKQGAAAKRICEKYSRQQIAQAAVGFPHLFPYSRGEPWDLFDLEAKFDKAMVAAHSHPDVKRVPDIEGLADADLSLVI